MEVFTKRLHQRSYKFTKVYCTVCGVQFETKLTDLNKGKGRCCSYNCAGKLGSITTNHNAPKKESKYSYYNNAHEIVRDAIEKGKLIPEPCEVCGTTDNIKAHHEDYDKPLDVQWYCHRHHMQLHAEKAKAALQSDLIK